MAGFNKVILLGNLTRDPELRYTASGMAVANFGLAVNRPGKGDDGKEETCFVDIVAFGRQAETCSEYLAKGKLVLIDGRLNYRKWQTEDGQSRSKLDVIASNVQFMPQQGRGGGPSQSSRPEGDSPGGEISQDTDVPF